MVRRATLQDWAEASNDGLDADPARRIAWLLVLLTLPLFAIGVRVADLQVRLQPHFLSVFAQTHSIEEVLPARNGRILGADGTILADDITNYDLRIDFRWLEEPPDPNWLRKQAWSRLSRSERRQPALVAAEIAHLKTRREQLWHDLSELTGRSPAELQSLCRGIQNRVDAIWSSVNERRFSEPAATHIPRSASSGLAGWWQQWRHQLTVPPERGAAEPLVIREQETAHTLLTNISADIAAEVEAHRERYPGVHITTKTRRVYPQHELAAHLLGARIGEEVRRGLEQQYNRILQGRAGVQRKVLNRQGEVLRTETVKPPQHGRDLVLTLDAQLQRRTEQLLDDVLSRVPDVKPDENDVETTHATATPPQGGCVVAMNVHTGSVVVAAAAPRFDANLLMTADTARWNSAAADPRKPFFPRVTQMAVPPGSVFKVASAVALLESGTYTPHSSVFCRGYLDQPEQYRCLTFRHYGFGHGNIELADALCRSCNVYFFAGARKAGPEALVEWSERLGIGKPTGIDVPGEASGRLPKPGTGTRWYPGDTLGLAIGQSSLTVTPLQMARLMAAVANDGYLVTPHLVASGGPVTIDSTHAADPLFAHPEPAPIPGLHQETLAAIRGGLTRAVHDPHGTAYHSVRLAEVEIAGKTGTAEVGGGLPDHAWFAGYVPADRPRIAFAVVLEHGGSGGKVAGPVAREFVKSLLEAGLLSTDRDLAVTNAN